MSIAGNLCWFSLKLSLTCLLMRFRCTASLTRFFAIAKPKRFLLSQSVRFVDGVIRIVKWCEPNLVG